MVEKKRSLTVSTNFCDFSDIDEKKKDEVRRYFPSYFSEDESMMLEECEYFIQELQRLMKEHEKDEKVQNYIVARVILMRNQCPSEAMSGMYNTFLQELKSQYPSLDYIDKPRYTMYFPNKAIPSLRALCKALAEDQQQLPDVLIMKDLNNESYLSLLKSIYNFYHGRIPRAEQLLLWYPDYLSRFFELQRVIMTEDGPLPLDWRYYLALVSVACYGCEYLYNLLLEGFIDAGGDITWLDANSTTLPTKFKRLVDTNYDLAYQPWTFVKEKQHQIAGLLKEPDAWSRLELIQVLIIFSFYHSFCCYVYATGVLPELDLPRDPQKDSYLRTDDDTWSTIMKNSPLMRTTNKDILEELNAIAKKAEEEKEKEEGKTEDQVEYSEKADESVDYGDDAFEGGYKSNTLFSKFFGDRKIDFLSSKQKKIDNNIYEWKVHGYSTIEEHFPEIAKNIDLKYEYINNLTLESFGENQGVKTQPFRKAIEYYIQLIFGYEYTDFDYKKINTLLRKDMKLAVKTIGSTPQHVTYSIINKFPVEFKPYEICHIGLLIMEAKFQIELMYGIMALQNAKE